MRVRVKSLLVRAGGPQILLGGGILVLLVLIALFAQTLAPHDPFDQNLPNRVASPTWQHPLGTDPYGRDLLSRLLIGAQASLFIGLSSVLVGGLIGIFFGLLSGYWGGIIDNVIMRVVDALLAFPTILLALVIVATLGSDTSNVIFAIAIAVAPRFARIIRGSVLSEKTTDYILATRALGAGATRIILFHILPNVLSPIIVTATFMVATAILVEAFLGFLGLGIQPPTPTWGNSINEGLRVLRTAPMLSVYPGIAITLTVVSFNLLGDGLRDALDPKLRGRVERDIP